MPVLPVSRNTGTSLVRALCYPGVPPVRKSFVPHHRGFACPDHRTSGVQVFRDPFHRTAGHPEFLPADVPLGRSPGLWDYGARERLQASCKFIIVKIG